jgi:hypothetical protein
MANNHLIIGLGGTGGNIIRSLRKTIYQAYGSDETPKVKLRYLYIDSDQGMMAPNDPSWNILGRSVQLPVRSQLHLSGLNLKQVIDDIARYPNLKPWIGNRSDWMEILNSADASRIVAGQKRRLGRFLFAVSAGRFREKITQFVPEMEQDNANGAATGMGATFHVCCGLAGGTGSGTVVDVVSQIRAAYPDPAYRIIIYAQLPERNPEANRSGPNYRANGYAALMELNALAINSWQPHDVLSSDGKRLSIQDPFNCCYLFSDENEANVGVSVRGLPDIVASFLFQKIVQSPNIDWGATGNILERQETFELGPQAKSSETSPGGAPRRTRTFFSFGIKQISYPEVEIQEYLTYSFAEQAARQLLYNNWVEGDEYKNEPVNQSFEEFVQELKQQEHWYLDEQHVTLSRGILRSEIDNKKWKPIKEYWQGVIPSLMTHVLDQYQDDARRMLPELHKLCQKVYNEQYRDCGVRAFYEMKRGDMTDHVRELSSRIEADLFTAWQNGTRSIFDTDRLLQSLLGALNKKLQNIDLAIAKLSENSEGFKSKQRTADENSKAWSTLGAISIAFGKHKSILSAQAEIWALMYIDKTYLEGYRFGRELIERLIHDVASLQANVGYCKVTVNSATESFRNAMDCRLRDEGQRDVGKQVVRQYDPEIVRRFVRDLSRDGKEQSKQTAEVRKRIAERLGGKLTFANFAAVISPGVLEDALTECCKRSAEAAHVDAVARHPERGQVLKVNVLEQLRREFDGNADALRQYTSSIMKMSRNYLKLNEQQKALLAPGIPAANNLENAICATYNTIIAPDIPELTEFRARFCDALRDQAMHGVSNVVVNNERSQEITIITTTNIFPARFSDLVGLLKEKYQQRIATGGKRAFLELHSEGEAQELAPNMEFFDLYPDAYKSADILPWLMLAQSLDLIREGQDYTTGREVLNFTTMDADGLPEIRPLGRDINAVIEAADPALMEELKHTLRNKLSGEYLRVEKRQELEDKVLSRLRSTAETHGADAPQYQREKEALPGIRRILKSEA